MSIVAGRPYGPSAAMSSRPASRRSCRRSGSPGRSRDPLDREAEVAGGEAGAEDQRRRGLVDAAPAGARAWRPATPAGRRRARGPSRRRSGRHGVPARCAHSDLGVLAEGVEAGRTTRRTADAAGRPQGERPDVVGDPLEPALSASATTRSRSPKTTRAGSPRALAISMISPASTARRSAYVGPAMASQCARAVATAARVEPPGHGDDSSARALALGGAQERQSDGEPGQDGRRAARRRPAAANQRLLEQLDLGEVGQRTSNPESPAAKPSAASAKHRRPRCARARSAASVNAARAAPRSPLRSRQSPAVEQRSSVGVLPGQRRPERARRRRWRSRSLGSRTPVRRRPPSGGGRAGGGQRAGGVQMMRASASGRPGPAVRRRAISRCSSAAPGVGQAGLHASDERVGELPTMVGPGGQQSGRRRFVEERCTSAAESGRTRTSSPGSTTGPATAAARGPRRPAG